MGPIERIKASGFKSIKQMDLELGKLNVLIGSNGAGKSNFMGLFRLLNNIVESNLQVYVGTCGGAETLLYFGRKSTDQITIELSFAKNTSGYRCALIPTADDQLIFKSEECWVYDKKRGPQQVTLGGGQAETELIGANRMRIFARWVREHLRSSNVYHFHDTSDGAKVKGTADLEDNRMLRPDAANLAAFLYRLMQQHPDQYGHIVDATRMVAPFFDDFILEPSRLNKEKIRLEWREKGSDMYFNAFALSDGTLRFICLSTLLLQPTLPQTILLDEPELGLHPYAITILAELLRGAATRAQVIVSSQSVSLVNQFEPDEIVVVEREEGQSVFRHLDKSNLESWLDDYGLGDLWEKNVLGGRP